MKDLLGRTVCDLCGKPADGPMLNVGETMSHVPCIFTALRQLLDPDWEPGKEPAKLPHGCVSEIESAE